MNVNKKCQVILTDTDDKTIIKKNLSDKLLFDNNVAKACPNQHLYILSNDPIKEGDWIFADKNILQVKKGDDYEMLYNCKKIIASTNRLVVKETPMRSADDFDLTVYTNKEYIPNIHPLFILEYVDEYNKGNKINFINVEFVFNITNEDWSKTPVQLDGYYSPKVDNEHRIFTSVVKESWTREEIVKIIHDYREFTWTIGSSLMVCDKWIEENL